MTASGIDAQLGIVDEVTYGDYVAPTRFYEFVDEGVKNNINRIDSNGLRAGRKTLHRWAPGSRRAAGPIQLELAPQGIGLLLKHAFGGVVTAGAGPYTHTYTPGAIDGKSFTMQIGRPDLDGTVRPFSYLGCKITEFEMAAAIDEYVKGTFSVFAADEVTSESLVTASYPSGWSPFVFTEAYLDVAGAEICVTEFALKANNGLQVDRHRIRDTDAAVSKEPKESEKRSYEVTFTADFENLTQYNRYTGGTEAALVLGMTDGTNSLVITMNTRFDGETPNVTGPAVLELPQTAMVTSGTSDAAAITAVLTNGDSAP